MIVLKVIACSLFMLVIIANKVNAKSSCFESELISKSCLNTNGAEIYNTISKYVNIAKSEYETKSDFDVRKRNELKKTIAYFRTDDSYTGFLIGNTKSIIIKGEYSPENKIIYYSLNDPTVIYTKFTDIKYYNASNAYGANVRVEKYDIYQSRLITKNGRIDINIPMDSSQAILLKDELLFYAFGKFTSEEPYQELKIIQPTIDNPRAISETRQYIPFDVTDIIIANKNRVLYIYSVKEKILRSNISVNQKAIDFMNQKDMINKANALNFMNCENIRSADKSIINKIINIKNEYGQTPIMLSVFENDFGCVEFLLKNGADISIRDNKNLTPLEFSKINKYNNISKLLESSINNN